jgi:hypothetical protein
MGCGCNMHAAKQAFDPKYFVGASFDARNSYQPPEIQPMGLSSKELYGPKGTNGIGYDRQLPQISYLSSMRVDNSFYHAGSRGL